MCGIAGLLELDPSRAADHHALRQMLGTLRHRGPDDEGVWSEGAVALGSRRLAIIDLSPRAHQPMASEDGWLHIAYNGEIYNFQELRKSLTLSGHRFRSDSDTEVLLTLYQEQGPKCLNQLRGMFAFAVWDARHRTLFVARDRLGKKPLFYYHDRDVVLFASEPKAILQHPRITASADTTAIHHYLTYGYVPGPWSAFQGIRKLPPAHYLTVSDGRVAIERYWSLHYVPKHPRPEVALGEELLALLEEAVRLRLISDVPLGALLSGGIDSSTIVALMRRAVSGRLRTFSIGFDHTEYDELAYAREVAQRFGTEHHELVVKPDAVEMLPRLVWHYGEPFADSSAVASFSLCAMARRSVTVALSGDGGDEAFIGYDRYLAASIAGTVDVLPKRVRGAVAGFARRLPGRQPKSIWYRLRRFAGALGHDPRHRYACWLAINDGLDDVYAPMFAEAARADSLRLLEAAYAKSDATNFVEATVHADIQTYLPDDLLVKMDIASMAHSLEVRSPFLDHHIVEFAAALPLNVKLRGLTQKYVLKKIMTPILPASVLHRKKMGFGVPLDHWFRHDLREMTHDVLLDSRARQRGYFREDGIRRLIDEHLRGHARHHQLWALVMLELWHRTFLDQRCPAGVVDACR